MVEGLIPFFFGAIKKRRATRKRKTTHYEHLSSLGSPPRRGLPERFTSGGASAYNSQMTTQSCRFVVAPSLAEELDLWRGVDDDDGRARTEGLLRAPLFQPAAGGDGRGGVSRSRRFGSMRV